MFNFDDKFFQHSHGLFPPEKPHFTVSEEVHHSAKQMRETIENLIKFESYIKEEFESMSKHLSSDNVIFKSTMRESWETFLSAVKNEINQFEANVTNSVELYNKAIRSDYETLSGDVSKQIADNLTSFNTNLETFKTAYLENFAEFKRLLIERVNSFDQSNNQVFLDFKQNVELRLGNYEKEVTNNVTKFQQDINESILNFKDTWSNTVIQRLDVQDLKIDEAVKYMKTNLSGYCETLLLNMKEAGEFNDIFESQVLVDIKKDITEKVSFCDTFSDIATLRLKEDMLIRTKGFSLVNDGGASIYTIKAKTTTYDETLFTPSVNDEFYAELVIENNTVNIKQLGATNDMDINPIILAYVDLAQKNNHVKLYLPSGVWKCRATEIYAQKGFHIFGDKAFIQEGYSIGGTILTAYENNQDYVLKIGNTDLSASSDRPTANFSLKDIVMSTGLYENNRLSTLLHVNTACLVLSGATLGFIDCIFQCIHGTALHINDSWELYFGITNFRCIADLNRPVLKFGKSVGTTSSGSNISAIEFQTLMFEDVSGDCILFDEGCRFDGNKIGHINAELAIETNYNEHTSYDTDNRGDVGTMFMSLIKCHSAAALIIDDINVSMLNKRVLTDATNNKWVYKYLINIPENGMMQCSIGDIHINNLGKNAKLLKGVRPNPRTDISIGSAIMWEENLATTVEESLLDLTEFPTIKRMTNLYRKKEGSRDIYKIPNTIPFYDIGYTFIASKIMPLNSDETSLTPLRVVVRSNVESNRMVARILNDSLSDLVMRVKGATATNQIQLISKSGGTDWHKFYEFEGTGDWQNVELDTSAIDDGAEIIIVDPITNLTENGSSLSFDILRLKPRV